MTDVDHLLLSRFYQIAKLGVLQLEACISKIKNLSIKTEISNQIANYDVIATECSTLAKAHKIMLPDYEFFKRCSELIESNLNTFSIISIDILLILTTSLSLNILLELYDVESASSETISIGKHLQNIFNNNLQKLKEFK